MQGDRISMSCKERDVLKVMSVVLSGRRTQAEAARLLGRSVRQVHRVKRRLESQGDVGVVHGLRGRPSNRRIDPLQHRLVIEAYSRDYGDFGPTLACEKLCEQGLVVKRETLRRWLIQEGLYKPLRNRDKHRSRRLRRMCFGELVQADGSPHDWLEGRGPWLMLLVMIDDATSKVVARFYEAETTEGYMDLLGRYCRKHGRMVSLYTDRNSIFWEEDQEGQLVQTQFTRALADLGIEWIPAYSPQAKGRVERFNGTAQDRLVKELRLAGACTLEEANEVLDKTFLPWFNRHCTVKAASSNDAHRPVHPGLNLAAILSVQESRTVANDYTIRYHNQAYQILPPSRPGLRGGKVIVESRLDGTRHIRFRGKYLAFEAIASAAQDRSLSLMGIPAGETRHTNGGQEGQGRTAVAEPPGAKPQVGARPCAVYPTFGRSGRTPAEPCLPEGELEDTEEGRWRPGSDHPWRKYATGI